jgi:hypothetical protein
MPSSGLISSSKIAPTAISTVGDIGLSNMSLKIITLSLYSAYFPTREGQR